MAFAGFLTQNHHEEAFSLWFFSYTFGTLTYITKPLYSPLLHQIIAPDTLVSPNPTSKSFPTCWFYITVTEKMSSASKAWLVAAAVGGVEALKDQGFCRWNYTLRSLHQHAKNHVRSASQAKKLSSSSSAMISDKVKEVTAKQSEESLRKVMYLSCWGPYLS